MIRRLFNFGRNNRLSLCPIVNDRYERVGFWLSGRVFGILVSLTWPWRIPPE